MASASSDASRLAGWLGSSMLVSVFEIEDRVTLVELLHCTKNSPFILHLFFRNCAMIYPRILSQVLYIVFFNIKRPKCSSISTKQHKYGTMPEKNRF